MVFDVVSSGLLMKQRRQSSARPDVRNIYIIAYTLFEWDKYAAGSNALGRIALILDANCTTEFVDVESQGEVTTA